MKLNSLEQISFVNLPSNRLATELSKCFPVTNAVISYNNWFLLSSLSKMPNSFSGNTLICILVFFFIAEATSFLRLSELICFILSGMR
jgi:hypothetical protein